MIIVKLLYQMTMISYRNKFVSNCIHNQSSNFNILKAFLDCSFFMTLIYVDNNYKDNGVRIVINCCKSGKNMTWKVKKRFL